MEKFWEKVVVTGFCWEWHGFRDRNGYTKWGTRWAHRMVYETLVGPIPEGLQLDHLCRNPICVNPDHLEPVTPAENSRRSMDLRRSELCPFGHSDWTTTKRGWRSCAECARIRARERYVPKGPQTHCKQGHPLSGSNVTITTTATGERRRCLTCHRERRRRSVAARRAD